MAEPNARNPETQTDRLSPPGMPRWVKVTSIAIGILLLLFLILQLSGVAGQHGPGRHMSLDGYSSGAATTWAVASATVE